jgi:hypothetical protein
VGPRRDWTLWKREKISSPFRKSKSYLRFGTLCLFHLHRQVGILHTYLSMKMGQSVPKRRHIKFRRRGITQKKTYNIQNTAKV